SVNYYFLLGLLNSKITYWYISKTSTQMRGGWYSFESRFIKSIPLRIPENVHQKSIIEKVTEIIAIKKQDPQKNTLEKEKEVDQLVYELYGLTEEEIKIVEESIKWKKQ
ncbi:MAG: hypothetical protein QQN41_09665, partial [Nitrosopumilus sp.]